MYSSFFKFESYGLPANIYLHCMSSEAQHKMICRLFRKSMAPQLDDLEDADERNYADHPNLTYLNVTGFVVLE